MNRIQYAEYRRRVFNTALLECFSRIHSMCTGLNQPKNDHDYTLAEMGIGMSNEFYRQMLNLDTSTISQTKKNLSEAVTFIQDCVSICESIAEEKAASAEEEGLDTDADKPELNAEESDLISKVFDEKSPNLQIEAIRDATVKALLAEDKKAQEIKDSLSIAQSNVAAGDMDEKSLEETVNRLGKRGPTSLMNAIINAVSVAAVKNVNENSNGVVPIGSVMAANADEIKTRSAMMYMLYESSSVFGIHKYTSAEVKRIAEEIYYGK